MRFLGKHVVDCRGMSGSDVTLHMNFNLEDGSLQAAFGDDLPDLDLLSGVAVLIGDAMGQAMSARNSQPLDLIKAHGAVEVFKHMFEAGFFAAIDDYEEALEELEAAE